MAKGLNKESELTMVSKMNTSITPDDLLKELIVV